MGADGSRAIPPGPNPPTVTRSSTLEPSRLARWILSVPGSPQYFLEETWKARPGVARWISDTHAFARRQGYVVDFLGRRRYVGGIRSSDRWIRLSAEREAQATPIQSGAQEVFKAWMGSIWWRVFQRSPTPGRYCEPWLQVHDDFICEVEQQHATGVHDQIQRALPQLLRVPVEMKSKQGVRWSDI